MLRFLKRGDFDFSVYTESQTLRLLCQFLAAMRSLALTNTTGAVTDTYDAACPERGRRNAFGNLIHSTGSTPNNYLFAGEQYDPDLHLYYNRARYLNVATGQFWTRDSYEGDPQSAISLHKYLYALSDPINRADPSGHDSIDELMFAAAISVTLTTLSNVLITGIFLGATGIDPSFDGAIASIHGNLNGNGWTVEGGIDLLWQRSTNSFFNSLTAGGGTNPLGTLPTSRAGRGAGYMLAIGPIFNMSDPQQMSGVSLSAVYPSSILHLIQAAGLTPNKAWGALTQLAQHVKNAGLSDMSAAFGYSSSGPTFAQFGLRSNSFGTFGFYGGRFYPLSGSGLENQIRDLGNGLQYILSLIRGGVFNSASSMAANADNIVLGVRNASQ
jgi:RHS repeat-associated protein